MYSMVRTVNPVGILVSTLLLASSTLVDAQTYVNAVGDNITCTWTSDETLTCNGVAFKGEELDPPGSPEFYQHLGICIFCVVFAGIMSGLTIGLLSFDVTMLQVLKEGGEPQERIYAASLIPLIEKKHWLLVTLLLCNAAAMETLPIFLDKMMPSVAAIIVSVTAVLFFGEIIPQAVCSKFGLAIGYYCSWPVYVLMWVLSPISWIISLCLDGLLGEEEGSYYRRDELKVLVDLHTANEEEPLSSDEITIIRGVLDMANKNVGQAMQKMESIYCISNNDVLDMNKIREIYSMGHSRIPVYRDNIQDITGCMMIKDLSLLDPDDATPLSQVELKPLQQVSEKYALFSMMNDFLTGESGHMALVYSEEVVGRIGSVIGIITLEDCIEEMICREIYDEADMANQEYRESVANLRRTSFKNINNRSALRKVLSRANMKSIMTKSNASMSIVKEPTETTALLAPEGKRPADENV